MNDAQPPALFSGVRVLELAQWDGEHTESILLELELTWEQISELKDAGVIL